MPYVEAEASGPSSRFVQAFWQSTGPLASPAAQRVLPDGCADFIFDLADPTRRTRAYATVIGTMTRAIVVPLADPRDSFGIRFRPGVLPLLWHLPMRALCDDRAALDGIVPHEDELTDRLSETRDFCTRAALAEAWIEARLAQSEIDVAMLRTVTFINSRLEAGDDSTQLAAFTGWNERKLQRFFEASYGTTPTMMRCFWRFERLRRTLLRGAGQSLSTLALDHAYADQAHMTREFRRFSGLSIGAWRAEAVSLRQSRAVGFVQDRARLPR